MRQRHGMTVRMVVFGLGLLSIASANLLSNSDFSLWDDDSTPTDWQVEARNYAQVSREDGQGHSSAPCLKLTRLWAGTGNNKGVLQNVTGVTPGVNYTVGGWFQTPAMPDTLQYASGRIVITWRNSTGSAIGSTNPSYVHQPVWTEQTYVAASPNNPNGDSVAASADIIIRCYSRSGSVAGGIVYADDASFLQGGAIAEGDPQGIGAARLTVSPMVAGRRASVSFALPRACGVRLSVYDMAGVERQALCDGLRPAGRHVVDWNNIELPSGLYFVALRSEGATMSVGKLLVQR